MYVKQLLSVLVPAIVMSLCSNAVAKQPTHLISQIQGEGLVSPLVGKTVVVDAIVVASFQGRAGLNGFYIQEQDVDSDNDAATSEGIFVYEKRGTSDNVSVGDQLLVTAKVTEFKGETQLVPNMVTRLSRGNALPTPAVIQVPMSYPGSLEPFEGMRVNVQQALFVVDNYNLARHGVVTVSSKQRLMIPTQVAKPGSAANKLKAQNDLDRLLLDDGRNKQNLDPIAFKRLGFSAAKSMRLGDELNEVKGVLGYAFGSYRLHRTELPVWIQANPRVNSPVDTKGSLRVVSFNVLNFFNGDGKGQGFPTERGADSNKELTRQRDKIVSAMAATKADILGLVELENDGYGKYSAIAELVSSLNEKSPEGHSYAFVHSGKKNLGLDVITNGFIYRVESVRPVGKSASLDETIDARFGRSRNRPALAQTFEQISDGERLTVVVNHFKSKGSSCDEDGDPNKGDGQGNCNQTRTNAATALVEWLEQDPTDSDDTDVLIIGDLNAYAKEDPITAILKAGYRDLIDQFVGADKAYTFNFRGQSGYLDHALASSSLQSQVVSTSIWHINADEPKALDYNVEYKSKRQVQSLYSADAFRSSDHDPVIVDLHLFGHH